ncbi:MAG: methylated-DNA--[protein]-cysteine S-methyltransferase [Lachnospiraceae bacterium]|nr:methylated-DNA--[protein]-cysteine S-methyltransferase [Lachnospiraceae bacterium]MBP3579257.1 methylated-DNA--[protein]-cysteine S-methyltransferase [Lachnospiraceae bacterium]
MPIIYHYNSPVGILEIKEENGYITGVRLLTEQEEIAKADLQPPATSLLQQAHAQLTEYFAGERTGFTLPIKYPFGTPFQHSVWNALRDIPYGETRSYEDIAVAIGNPKAVRAIGQANTRNPILLLVPCHRVINKNGTIGGFGCGVEVKQKLLELEGVNIK